MRTFILLGSASGFPLRILAHCPFVHCLGQNDLVDLKLARASSTLEMRPSRGDRARALQSDFVELSVFSHRLLFRHYIPVFLLFEGYSTLALVWAIVRVLRYSCRVV